MKLGATPNQIKLLAALIVLAVIAHFMGGDDRPPSDAKRSAATPPPMPISGSAGPRAAITPAATKGSINRPNSKNRTSQEFKPVLRPRRVEDRIDPATIDPTLRTDLLAKLGSVPIQGGSRPLFEFGTAPPPPKPDIPKIIPKPPPTVVVAPPVSTPVKPVAPQPPKAPPIPLKFYGFTAARAGAKRAFFLENEDVYVANEGEIVKKRYKIVRINMNSVVMEDTEFKQQQTIPLTEQIQ